VIAVTKIATRDVTKVATVVSDPSRTCCVRYLWFLIIQQLVPRRQSLDVDGMSAMKLKLGRKSEICKESPLFETFGF
jgi:hypothetical protein